MLLTICNPILDRMHQVTASFVRDCGLSLGESYLVGVPPIDRVKWEELLGLVSDPICVAGGSCANSAYLYHQICSNREGAIIGRMGNDVNGDEYAKQMAAVGVVMVSPRQAEQTGICLALTTPERTMVTDLGASGSITAEDVGEIYFAKADKIILEGYVLLNPQGEEVFTKAIELARKYGVEIYVSLSAPFVIDAYREKLLSWFGPQDVVIGNDIEVEKLIGKDFRKFFEHFPKGVVSCGEEGALYFAEGDIVTVPTAKVKVIDLVGAGDAFFGAFLALDGDYATKIAGAHRFAAKVIGKLGARLSYGEVDALRYLLK